MAIEEVAGEYSLAVTSTTFERLDGGASRAVLNLEGTASGFGTANGTLIMIIPGPGANAGPGQYTGVSFLENGETVGVTGEGCWEKLGSEHKWRVRGINMYSNGEVNLSDGTLDLATRTFNGTLAPWT